MGNGANKLFNIIGKTSNKSNTPSLVTLTVNSTNPLTFKLDDKLTITEEFYLLEIANGSFDLDEKVNALVLNDNQLYYILNGEKEIERLKLMQWTLLATVNNTSSGYSNIEVPISNLGKYNEFVLTIANYSYPNSILASTTIPMKFPSDTSMVFTAHRNDTYTVSISRASTGLFQTPKVLFRLQSNNTAKLYAR